MWVRPPSVTLVASMKRFECWSKVSDVAALRVGVPKVFERDSCMKCMSRCGEPARASRGGAGERNCFGVVSRSFGDIFVLNATRSVG